MKIAFSGFENPVELKEKGITVLRIRNEALFARVCESLVSLEGGNASEPYSIWDECGNELAPMNVLMVIPDPFNLPWRHKNLQGALYSRFENELLLDEELRGEIQQLGLALESFIQRIGFQFNANYEFGVEWNMSSYLKAFSYGVQISDSATLLDNLIGFIDLGADMGIDKVFVFINLGTFLTKNEIAELQERLFFHGFQALLLEQQKGSSFEVQEKEYVVDRHFVEYILADKSGRPPSSQGRICSNGFGAVTF